MKISEIKKASHVSLKLNPEKFYKVERCNKKTVTLFSGRRVTYSQIAQTKIVNPTSQAKKLYQEFNRRAPDKITKMSIPINANTKFVKLGNIDNLEYISDKQIFKTDQKSRKRKVRTYIHKFSDHGKNPILFSNDQGNVLIIYDPENKIEVKAEGII